MSAGVVAALSAVGLSVCTVLACIISVPIIWNAVSSINDEIDADMLEFNVLAEDAWKEMISMKKFFGISAARKPRQSGGDFGCFCNAENKCPPGEKGEDGQPGMDGPMGEPGLDGKPGLPGNMPPVPLSADGKCVPCPFGKPGNKGLPGSPGERGIKGAPGKMGPFGEDGRSGPRGEIGEPGPPGNPGPTGEKGIPGREGTKYMPGKLGPKGMSGSIGHQGFPGAYGKPGKPGMPGSVGLPGMPGKEGEPGKLGVVGKKGKAGPPGSDAQYCACPKRFYDVKKT